jgi:hypothetical protein
MIGGETETINIKSNDTVKAEEKKSKAGDSGSYENSLEQNKASV